VYQHQAGVYFDSLQTAKGCDSVMAVNVSFDSLDVTVGFNNYILTSSATNVKYQWLNCAQNYAVLVGDTFQNFTPTQVGSYAVEVSKDGCVDTSACVPVVIIGINESSIATNLFEIMPNPNNGQFYIQVSELNGVEEELLIYDIKGMLYGRERITSTKQLIDFSGLTEGMYIVKYKQHAKRIVIKN
jgi:hypothetical protein